MSFVIVALSVESSSAGVLGHQSKAVKVKVTGPASVVLDTPYKYTVEIISPKTYHHVLVGVQTDLCQYRLHTHMVANKPWKHSYEVVFYNGETRALGVFVVAKNVGLADKLYPLTFPSLERPPGVVAPECKEPFTTV